MKKNKIKSAYWYQENLKKYRLGFLTYNLVIFSIVFILFSVALIFLAEERFFNSVHSDIIEIERSIDENSEILYSILEDDPRVSIVYYYANPKVGSIDSLINPKVTDFLIVGNIMREDITPIENIASEIDGVFRREKIRNHEYISFTTKTWKIMEIEGETQPSFVVRVKIYMNIDGELVAQDELKTTLMISTLIIILLGCTSSFLIMKRSMRPLKDFVEKQISFVSDASHELRTPLAIVQSKIENILANPTQNVYDVSEDLAISLKEISRLNKLTQELLTLARSDQNRLTYNFEKVNLNIVLNEIVEPFIEIASFEERTLEYKGEDIEAYVDKDKFRELIIILLDNALKYTNPNDTIIVTLKHGVFDVEIEVADTGIGISDETKKRIFERFYREDKTRSRETGGNGLGLSIAKTIVTDMKGKIFVDHNHPKGTVFTISLPKIKEKR